MKKILQKILEISLMVCLLATTGITGMTQKNVKAAGKFQIHYIDVGQADAALLQYGEGSSAKYALIDAGAEMYHKSSDKTYAQKEAPAYEYLKKNQIKRLEFILITHPHQNILAEWKRSWRTIDIEIGTIYGK